MKNALSWILQIIVVGALAFGAFKFLTKTEPQDEAVTATALAQEATLNLPVETLSPLDITPEYVSLAKVEEWQSSTLASEATGRVVWVCDCFEEGQYVEAGKSLLQIDNTSYTRDVVDREKDLVNARAGLLEAEADTEQARENYAALDLGEPNDIVLKLPELEAARLIVTSANAALEIAQNRLDETTIIAPYSGIISKTGATMGDLIGNGANLGTLVGTDQFLVRFPILENQLSLAQVGAEIQVETTTQPMFMKTGIIKSIDIDIDASTRLNSVLVAVQNPLEGDVLRLGRFVNGTFVGQTLSDVFAIPLIALDNEMQFFQIGEDQRLVATKVTPIYRDFTAVYIAADGRDTLNIVTGNVLGLREGMRVQGYQQ